MINFNDVTIFDQRFSVKYLHYLVNVDRVRMERLMYRPENRNPREIYWDVKQLFMLPKGRFQVLLSLVHKCNIVQLKHKYIFFYHKINI